MFVLGHVARTQVSFHRIQAYVSADVVCTRQETDFSVDVTEKLVSTIWIG